MIFTQEELALGISCHDECRDVYESSPDVMLGHLVETHDYTVAQAEECVKDWIKDQCLNDVEYESWYAEDWAHDRAMGSIQ